MKSWIYHLTKAELIEELSKLNLPAEGIVDTLRQRLSEYVDKNPEYPGGTSTEGGSPDPPKMEDTPRTPATQVSEMPNTSQIMNQIRKWGCHFDGRDPLAFLERIEELRQGYGYSGEQLLLGLPELLKGDVLLWYRNNRDEWTTWKEFDQAFRQQYLPRRYRVQLTKEIQSRFQQPDEPFGKYATAMLTSMRRAGGFTAEDRLEKLYDNMSPAYKLYVRLDDLTSVNDLSARAAEFEAIEKQRRAQRSEKPTTTKPAVAAAAYNRDECCWRCKQRGHTRLDCRRPPKKFCSRCGKDGILTRECHPAPGNANRIGGDAAANRSDPPSE